MASIKFYFNAPDRLQTACSITQKALQQGHKITLWVPDKGRAAQIDALLWQWQPSSFLPHVAQDSPLAAQTPIIIAHTLDSLPHRDVLINLDDAPIESFADFAMLIEIVSTDDTDRQTARQRWQHFKQQGHTLTAFDLTKR